MSVRSPGFRAGFEYSEDSALGFLQTFLAFMEQQNKSDPSNLQEDGTVNIVVVNQKLE